LRWLNEYFSELVPVISSNNGVISTFAGDSLVAFFGVLPKPIVPAEGAYCACVAATQMSALIERLNERRLRRGEPPLITGIALHSGMVTAGGLGSSERLQYTIVGDTVNATSRLNELTRNFQETLILISQQTVDALGVRVRHFSLEALGNYELRGKLAPMTIYRLSAYHPTYDATPVDQHGK
jgi:adenylate cyclase